MTMKQQVNGYRAPPSARRTLGAYGDAEHSDDLHTASTGNVEQAHSVYGDEPVVVTVILAKLPWGMRCRSVLARRCRRTWSRAR
jgi:hypothetical protein